MKKKIGSVKKSLAKKVPKKKPASPSAKKALPAKKSEGKRAGVVTHYFAAIKVAIVKCAQPFEVGATLGFRGATTKFDQKIISMQFDHKPIARSKKGQEVGIKVGKRVREGDRVFIV